MPRTRWPLLLRVAGRSMEPALADGDLVLTIPGSRLRRRGDLVVLRRASGARYIKRVAAVGGDVVELEAGRLRVNGRSGDGRPRLPGASVTTWVVPVGRLFVVGDNAGASDDSRTWREPFVLARSTRRALRVPWISSRTAGTAA